MGRPKKYDRDDVLEKAMTLFWTRGYADASVQDLEAATEVNKSGLYAEFEGKDDIFVSSLLYYYAHRGSEKFLTAEPPGWQNVENFFKFVARGWAGRYGCLHVNSMRELEILPAEARKLVSRGRIQLARMFEKNIAAERTVMSAGALAEIAATFFSGLAIESNIKTRQAAMRRQIEDFMRAMRRM